MRTEDRYEEELLAECPDVDFENVTVEDLAVFSIKVRIRLFYLPA